MKKYIYVLCSIILLLFVINIDIVITSTKYASTLFFNKIFISIFPFIILSDILIYFDYHIFLKNVFGKFLSKVFNIPPNSSIIFILSILTSHPSNSIFIKDMLDNNQISTYDSNKLLTFTYFPSISFVIGTIGIYLYKSFKIGLLIYSFVLLNNILIGLLLRKNKNQIESTSINIKKDSFFNMLKSSILKAINTSYIILGNLIIFTIIINLFKNYFQFNDVILSLISGVLELTNGIMISSLLDLDLSIKLTITVLLLCFSSLSIIFQSKSILSEYDININKIIFIKLLTSIITSSLFYTLLKVLNI